MLAKFKSDLERPFNEATTFLNDIETQLTNLCAAPATTISNISGQFLFNYIIYKRLRLAAVNLLALVHRHVSTWIYYMK